MNTQTQEALKMAIEAFENIFGWKRTVIDIPSVHQACKEALTQPQKQWVGLSDLEISKIIGTEWWKEKHKFAKAIETKLKELNP